MGKFLKFERMLTPIIIHLVFWLGVIGSIISGLVMMGFGIISDSAGFIEVIMGFLTILFGPIVVRIYCEMMMVIFKILGVLSEIRDANSENVSQRRVSESPEQDVI